MTGYRDTGWSLRPIADPALMAAAMQDATKTPAPAANKGANLEILALILRLVSLAPIIANGIAVVKKDCDLGQKQQAASDALDTVVNGVTGAAAVGALSPEHQSVIAAVTGIAKDSMNATITALHNSAPTPAAA